MSQPAEHPDDLLARARRGPLGALEQERLDAHLRRCRACAFEQSVARDIREEVASVDAAWLDRVVEGATAEALTLRVQRPAATRRTLVWLVAAAVALVAVSAMAAVVVVPRLRQRTSATAPQAQRTHAQTTDHAIVRSVAPHVETPPPAPVVETPAPVESHPSVRAPAPSAAELYRRANDARHARDDREAARLYDALITRHPASREALQARMSFGRLLLDRREQPDRAARLFEEYLRRAPGAPDEEAALAGLARASQALGRRNDERAAWERLLARHPDSVHAETARSRLDALRDTDRP